MKKYYLYLKESPLGLKYLGMTRRDPYKYKGSGLYWMRHLKTHKFRAKDIKTIILIETFDKNELKRIGIYYSELWNIVKSENFANLTIENAEGSLLGYKFSEESRRKMSFKRKGKPITEEHRNNISKGKTGLKRKPFSEECKNKMSESHKGKIRSEEHCKRLSEALKNKIKTQEHLDNLGKAHRKPIIQFDLNGNFIKEWSCAKEAALNIDIVTPTTICRCCKGISNSTGGFKWEYKNEKDKK